MNEPIKYIATGEVKAISTKNNSLLLDETWYNFPDLVVADCCNKGDNIKLTYIVDGKNKFGITLEVLSKAKKEKEWHDDMVSFDDLLNAEHKKIKSITTHIIQIDMKDKFAVFKAIVTTDEGKYFEAHGDATQENCQSGMIKPHFIRMAETRAIARALRWMTNNAMTAEEEIA